EGVAVDAVVVALGLDEGGRGEGAGGEGGGARERDGPEEDRAGQAPALCHLEDLRGVLDGEQLEAQLPRGARRDDEALARGGVAVGAHLEAVAAGGDAELARHDALEAVVDVEVAA